MHDDMNIPNAIGAEITEKQDSGLWAMRAAGRLLDGRTHDEVPE